jgi:hypothetical protein
MNTTQKKERGRIVNDGMGGFLAPPTHPTHTHSVETDLRRRPENRSRMALDYATSCEWLDDATRGAARRMLRAWEPLPLSHPEVQEWISQILGYFRSCYLPENGSRDVRDLLIMPARDPMEYADQHRGVDFIREFYPDFQPTPEHFAHAYWGTKPDAG